MSKSRLSSISRRPKRPRAKEPEQGLAKRLCTDAESAPTTSSDSKFICRRCKTIDFGQDVGDVRGRWKVKAKLILGYEDLDLACSVCSFFLSMIPERSSPGGPPGDQYYLCATSAQMAFFSPNSYDRQSLKKSHPKAHASRLSTYTLVPAQIQSSESVSIHPSLLESHIQKTGVFTRTSSDPHDRNLNNLACRCVLAEEVDFKRVREWLGFCNARHGESCQSRPSEKPRGFRVIDCNTRSILESLGNINYLALSYVWGPQPESASNVDNTDDGRKLLPSNVPQVILDAMTVTLNLGYQYLWVDKYCISQNASSEEKHEQIRNMDVIYRDACLTIIAASGESGCHGLPGVSRPRVHQPRVSIGEDLYVSSTPDPLWVIRNSCWATRGWTYQEALLSRRRLVFTDHQVYFQCFVMHTSESIDIPLAVSHKRRQGREWGAWNKPGAFPVEGVGSSAPEIWRRIAEYSARKFSYESDILNGIHGVFHTFELRYPGFSHLWGIPVWNGNSRLFVNGLLWAATIPSKRRTGFPSWSWTGWLGPASRAGLWKEGFYSVTVNIELSNGKTISPHEFFSSDSEARIPHSSLSRFLHISGPIVDITVIHKSLPQHYNAQYRSWWAQIHLSNHLSIIAPFEWTKDVEGLGPSHTFVSKGICFWSGYESCILAVESRGDYAERIGYVMLHPADYVDTFKWHREFFFCISEGSSLLEEAETLARFDRERKDLSSSSRRNPSSWIKDFPRWWHLDDLGQVISFDRIRDKLWMGSANIGAFFGVYRTPGTAESYIRIG